MTAPRVVAAKCGYRSQFICSFVVTLLSTQKCTCAAERTIVKTVKKTQMTSVVSTAGSSQTDLSARKRRQSQHDIPKQTQVETV